MTDEITRCRQCGWIYPRTAIDKGYHKQNCPYDIRLRVQGLEEENALLKERLDALGGKVQEVSTPSPAPSGEDIPWDDEDDEDNTVEESDVVTVSPAIDREDDGWDDEEPQIPVLRNPLIP